MSNSFEHPLYQSRSILLSHSLKMCSKMTACVTLILILFNSLCYCFTCSASNSNSYLITSNQYSFTGYTITKAYNMASGPISSSLYYSYSLYLSSYYTAIRKINQDGSLAWMAALSIIPIQKSLTVDALEQYVYVSYSNNPLIVIRLAASTGSIVDAQSHSFLIGFCYDIKTHLLSDGSGYYITGSDTSPRGNICKYLFTSPTTTQCQKIIDVQSFLYGQIKLSEVSFFMIGLGYPAPNSLHIYKHTFGNSSPDWSLTMACPSGTCTTTYSESLLVSSSIYSFFIYGSTPYVYMAVISLSDGSVSSRYKSSISCSTVSGSVVSGDYIVATIQESYPNLLLFNRVTNSITIKKVTNGAIYQIGLEPSTNR